MEYSINIKRQIYICYGIAIVAAISLFFTGKYEAGFAVWFQDDPTDGLSSIYRNLSLHKIAFFILDFSLFCIIATSLPTDDERVEKIRAFVIRQTFGLAIMSAAFLGLVIPGNFNPLIYVLCIECYYLLAFRLYLYRDSRIIYLTVAEQQAKAAANKKRAMISGIVMGGLSGLLLGAAENHHWLDQYWIIMAVLLGIWLLVVIIYASWKN